MASEILANKGLSDATYAAAEKTMGLESLVALVATTGSFSMTCITAGTFKIDPPANDPTPLALRVKLFLCARMPSRLIAS